MKIDEVIKVIKQFRDREGNSADDIEAFDITLYFLDQISRNKNRFSDEVVDFFNDIMDTLQKDLSAYNVSNESVIYARNRVYDVFSRRYKIKEIEKDEKK